jgi:hypothetical protein
MSEPMRPLREAPEPSGSPEELRAAELVKLVSEIQPRPVDVAKGWDDVIERVARPHRSSRFLVAAACAAMAVLAWMSIEWRMKTAPVPPREAMAQVAPVAPKQVPLLPVAPTPPAVAERQVAAPPSKPKAPKAVEPPLSSPPLVEVAQADEAKAPPVPEHVTAGPHTIWSAPGDDSLRVEHGRVEIESHPERYTVVTPEVSVAASNARFAADVTENGTSVRVFEGEVAIFTPGSKEQVVLRAGDERTFVSASAPSALDVVPPEVSSPACARRSLEQRVACLNEEAKGEGLKAQTALYEEAYLLARAGRAATAELTLRESLRRFPEGVLHPEVRIALLKALMMQGRLREAAEVGHEFLAQCPDDPRVTDVMGFLRNLEWVQFR